MSAPVRLSIITGRPLEWTTGLTSFCTKYHFIFLLVHTIYRSFLTWPPASLATSFRLRKYQFISAASAIQPVQ